MGLLPITVAFFGGGEAPLPSYNPAFSGSLGTGVYSGGAVRVYTMWGDDDGGIWVGGDATGYDNVSADSVFKINNDGTLGTICNTTSQNVRALYVDDDNVYVGYSSAPYFEVFDKTSGTLQTGWPSFDSDVRDIKGLSNGNIVVAGKFTLPHQNFTAINPNTKTLPSGFQTHTFTIVTPYANEPRTLLVDSDDKILLGGPFTQVDSIYNVNSGFRMNSDGGIDYSFTPTELYRAGVGGGPYIGYKEVSYNGTKQYLAYGAFFSAWDGSGYSDNYNIALLDNNGSLASTWNRQTAEVGVSANAICVNNDTGHFYLQYGGTNQTDFRGVPSPSNLDRTILKFALTNDYVGDGNWMTNNVTTAHDPIYCMFSQEEWGAAPGSPILIGGNQLFTTYNTVFGIGSIAAIEPGNGSLLTR